MKKIIQILIILTLCVSGFSQGKAKQQNVGAFKADSIQSGMYLQGRDTLETKENVRGKQYLHGIVARPVGVSNPLPTTITSTTFTISTATNPITYYNKGVKVVVNTNQSVVIGSTVGLYYIYFNGSTGTLSHSNSFPGVDALLIATVYWNGSTLGLVGDERHSYLRNLQWHQWAHNTIGTRYRNGLTLTHNGGTGAAATFSTTLGEINDEDIQFITPVTTTARLWYRTGASAYTFNSSLSTIPYVYGANSRPIYVRSDTYASVEMNSVNNRYINAFVYATTDLQNPIYIFAETVTPTIAGTNGYTSVANARAVPFPNLSTFGLSSEMKPLYRLVIRADGQLQAIDLVNDDYRTVSSLPQAAGNASTTASIVSYSPTTYVTSSNVQNAIQEVGDSLKVAKDSIANLRSRLNTLTSYETVSRTIYVATTGSDLTGDGKTISTPFASLTKALSTVNSIVNSTIILQVASGTYNLTQDIFSLLTRFSGSGSISILGTMSYVPIVLGTNTDSSLWRPINTYNGSAPLLGVNQFRGSFLSNGTTKWFPISGNDINRVRYYEANGINYAYTQIATISTQFNITVSGTIKNYFSSNFVITLNNLNLNYTNTNNSIYVYYPNMTMKWCKLNPNYLLIIGAALNYSYNTFNGGSLRCEYPIPGSSLIFNAFLPYVGTDNGFRLAIVGGATTFYANYIETDYAKRANGGSQLLARAYLTGSPGYGFLAIKNATTAIQWSSYSISTQGANEKLYCDSITNIFSAPATGVRFVLAKDKIRNINNNSLYTSFSDFANSAGVKYELLTGTSLYIKGNYFPTYEDQVTTTVAYNTTSLIPIGDKTQNTQIKVQYSITRGTYVYSGEILIIPGSSLWYKNDIFGDGLTHGITITPIYDVTSTNVINLQVVSDNSDANTTTINYNVTRIMK